MKNVLIKLAAISVIASFMGGCASVAPVGIVYTGGNMATSNDVVAVNNKIPLTKTGKACMTSVLALVATGDNTVESAKANGNITNIGDISYTVDNVLGIYGTYCTIVKGN